MQFDFLAISDLVGLLMALLLTIFLGSRPDSSAAAKTYGWGSFISFIVGGTFVIYLGQWPSVENYIGIIGGYVLMLLAAIQYYFDRLKSKHRGRRVTNPPDPGTS